MVTSGEENGGVAEYAVVFESLGRRTDFTDLPGALESQFGADTKQIIETYRRAMPDATAPDIFVAIESITMMGLGSVEIAQKKAVQNGAPVYLYNFGYKSEQTIPGTDYPLGTPHAMDTTFKFNNETPNQDPGFLSGSNPDRFTASHNMAELWTSFARTSIPGAVGVPEWPAYNLGERPTMRIDTKCELIYSRFNEELAMWRSIGRL